MPNLTNALQPVALSTTSRIIALMDLSDAGDSRTAFIQSMIDEVSADVCEYLGQHTLQAERTERYMLRKFSKSLSLDGAFLTGTTTVKIAGSPGDLASSSAEIEDTDYVLNERTGSLQLLGAQPYDPAFLSVTYTGGFFANTGEIGTKHTWLTSLAEMQILYRLQRQDTLGGNVDTSGGQGTTFSQGSYGLLPRVRDQLKAHRRVVV